MFLNYENIKPGYTFTIKYDTYTVVHVDYPNNRFVATYELDDMLKLAKFEIHFINPTDLENVEVVLDKELYFTLCDLIHHHCYAPVACFEPERN